MEQKKELIKVCVPRLLTKEQEEKSYHFAVKENHLNRIIGVNPQRAALEYGKKWSNGKVLNVSFLNGDLTQKEKCQREAHRWETYANIKFNFLPNNLTKADLRVAFYDPKSDNKLFQDQGSWSYVGTDCYVAPDNEQTINFGWLDKDTDDAEYERVVVHEFGHALGLDHENSQPSANIQWNKPVVYKYFEGPPNNWSKQDVDDNVLNPTGEAGILHTSFDPTSIMAYSIPPEFTLDKKGVVGGVELSQVDKIFIGAVYPFGATPVISPEPNLVPGSTLTAIINAAGGVKANTFGMNIPKDKAGNYRVWTSYTDGIVSIYPHDDLNKVIASGTQQVTAKLPSGDYAIIVAPKSHLAMFQYRIVCRKI